MKIVDDYINNPKHDLHFCCCLIFCVFLVSGHEYTCVCMLWVSILPLHLLDFGTVLAVWCFFCFSYFILSMQWNFLEVAW